MSVNQAVRVLFVLVAGWCLNLMSSDTVANSRAQAVQNVRSNPPQSLSLKQREQLRIKTLQRISPSVVCVMAPDGQGGGSGVLISADDYAISNFHVTDGSGPFMKCGLNDGRLYDAVIVGIDPTGDIALIKLTGRDDFPFAIPGNSDQVRAGDEVLALGNPFLLAEDFTPTVTYGIVSGTGRYQYPAGSFLEYTDCIQIDASINPGNSGGPLFDINGNWIGINGRASFEKRGRVNSGAAYAISVRQVLLFLEHLKSGLIVDHGVADFTVETLPNSRVVVSQVSEVSEAWRRGLRPQDELVSFGGRALTSANDFQNILGIFPEATRVPMSWRNRDGLQSCTIRLRPLHAFAKLPATRESRRPSDPNDPESPSDPHAQPKPVVDAPAEIVALYEERDGFTNFHFNKQKSDQVLKPLSRLTADPAATWIFKGTLSALPASKAGSAELVIGQAGAGLSVTADVQPNGDRASAELSRKARDWYQAAAEPVAENEPADFYGLLTASLQLHRFLTQKAAGFDEVVAMGQTIHLPSEQVVDVLLTKDGARTSRWYFQDGQVLPFGVDVVISEGADEARVMFADWNESSDFPAPGRIGVVSAATETVNWLTFTETSLRQLQSKQAALSPDADGIDSRTLISTVVSATVVD